ncbi:hypothetical protein BC830DRAFT_1090382, partial [Chytriomyces sp. MP71]
MDLEQAHDPAAKRHCCTFPGCTKAFSTSAHLARHAINHTGVRKYKCTWPACTSSFFRADGLSQHIRVHTKQQEQQEKAVRMQCNLPFTSFHHVVHTMPSNVLRVPSRSQSVHQTHFVATAPVQIPHRVPSSPHAYLQTPRQSPMHSVRHLPINHQTLARPVFYYEKFQSQPQLPLSPSNDSPTSCTLPGPHEYCHDESQSGPLLPPLRDNSLRNNSLGTLLDAAQSVDGSAPAKASLSFLL